MRYPWILIVLYFGSASLQAQDSLVRDIMLRGIELHDAGEYASAISTYNEALALQPKNGFVNYEIAYSYYAMGDQPAAIQFAKVAAKETSENGLQATILLGSIYDERGDYKRSVKVLKSAIKTYGDYYLIWYNLGVTVAGHEDLAEAEEAFLNAIQNKLDHANSHFALGRVLLMDGRRVEALYPFLFCALLEPGSDRSRVVYQSIEELFSSGVELGDEATITMNLSSDEKDPAMRSAELMMSMLEASRNLEKYDTVDAAEIDREILTSFLTFMDGLDLGKRDDFFTRYYIPFFGAISASEHMEAFFHYIRMTNYPTSEQWCSDQPDRLQEFFDWLDTLDFGD